MAGWQDESQMFRPKTSLHLGPMQEEVTRAQPPDFTNSSAFDPLAPNAFTYEPVMKSRM